MTLGSHGHFQIRVTNDTSDILRVLELREACFKKEFALNETEKSADHLIVEDTITNEIVGAYRLCASSKMKNFESELEFDLQEWVQTPGTKLELGWACTREGYREGVVIKLLWKGLSQYIKERQIATVFGSASLSGDSVEDLKGLLEYLKDHQFDLKGSLLKARPSYDLTPQLSAASVKTPFIKRQLPALMRAYLMAGALVLLQPIFDPDSNCFDLMTVLDVTQTSSQLKNHFDL